MVALRIAFGQVNLIKGDTLQATGEDGQIAHPTRGASMAGAATLASDRWRRARRMALSLRVHTGDGQIAHPTRDARMAGIAPVADVVWRGRGKHGHLPFGNDL